MDATAPPRPVRQDRPTRFDAQLVVRAPADLLAQVDAIADRRQVSRGRIVRDALEALVRFHGESTS